jgi:TPP-dependent pyruvate/acetoin dehydrogenase alpha subunit
VGAAWSAKLRGEPSVVVAYFGDGATSTGDFHAGLNFAAVFQLPTVFVCKNNGWAISLPVSRQTRVEHIADKAAGYGIPGERVDGNDLLAVYAAASGALERARSGGGPTLLELVTQRMGPHSTSDDPSRYRDPALLKEWEERDPIARMRRYLEARNLWSEADEERARSEWDERVTTAMRWAERQSPPDLASMFEDVYAEMPWHLKEQQAQLSGGECPS